VDASLSLAVLIQQSVVDPNKITIIGHSEGSMITPRIAIDNATKVKNIVLMGVVAQNLPDLQYYQIVTTPVLYAEKVLDHNHDGLLSLSEASKNPVFSAMVGNLTLLLETTNGTKHQLNSIPTKIIVFFYVAQASAKTLFFLEILEYRKGVYFDGSNTTNRILDVLEEERPRVICIDELDSGPSTSQLVTRSTSDRFCMLENGSSADVVAKVVLNAVTSENPSLMYLAGKDIESLKEAKRNMSDEEFYRMMKQNLMK
jgi:hypothetical protein